jgi:BASS family bile acid:Na+ symporter
MPRRIALVLLINYLVMGGIILLMGRFLIEDRDIWTGLVIIAAVPPAAAAIPWTNILGGDTLFSLISLLVAYLISIVVTPTVMIAFLGAGSLNPLELLILVGQFILIPLALSRIILFAGVDKYVDKWRGTIVNWGFFIVLFTIIGLNRQAFFGEFDILIRLSIIAITTSFGLSYATERVAKAFGAKQETIISLILVGIMKNFGLASGIALALFGERAAIPASIMTVFFVSRTLWLNFHFKKPPQPVQVSS